MITSYNAASEDGFISRADGSEDFIPDEAWDYFLSILPSYDVIVMGRKTYETIQAYPSEMATSFDVFPIKRIVVSRDEAFAPKPGYSVISSVSEIPTVGKNILLNSGPSLNTSALKAGIIDFVKLMVIPEKIGEGIPVFHEQPNLVLVSTEQAPSGQKVCTYKIEPNA